MRKSWTAREMLIALAIACATSAAGATPPTRYAWLRDGSAYLWTVDAPQADASTALPSTLQTPLGSVWKLFVYAYLVDRHIAAPDYDCGGGNKEEVYCCTAGGSIDRDHALIQSCGLFFDPARLRLDTAGWREYWRARKAPAWLADLRGLQPERRVSVASLLQALASIPARTRDATADTLVSVITSGHGQGAVTYYGGLLRVKTWTMPTAAGGYQGGAAGWLADGTPVWLGGPGGSRNVLINAAPRLAPRIARARVPDDEACVAVNFFARYAIRKVLGPGIGDDGEVLSMRLRGNYTVVFENGNRLAINSRGEMRITPDKDGRPQIVGRFGLNDYVARVVQREGDTVQPEAARALAVVARSYLVQQAGRERGCYLIDDSSRTQRVLPRNPGAAARAAADFTDSLVLAGAPVQFHRDQAAPNQMSWLAAKQAARGGAAFDAILAATWPKATLTSFMSSLAGDCLSVAGADDWLRREAPIWARQLAGRAGYETPPLPAVCEASSGRPYADAGRNRVYIYRLDTEEDRIALTHEYLHLAFEHHPRGVDEAFIEHTARQLMRGGN
ncbi:MAG: DUF2300 domain-containing protein [Bordetella sp.]|uniref:DUF2300 domain-containing protein n=1 Tax=Bordetella sp. TaxID=28081 RepID=UPI003F7BDC94